MKKKMFTSLGLMSGTSMDGVDLSIIKSDGYDEFHSIFNIFRPFDNSLFEQLIDLRDKISNTEDLKTFSQRLSELEKKFTLFNYKIISDAINNINENIDLIGFHGQTIFHQPKMKISKQIGDGRMLSTMIKKIVINNFRQNDLDHGGQGAPLTPIFHNLISEIINSQFDIKYPLSIINIGGITNVTQIQNKKVDNLNENFFAYDIAPGNCLIDKWVRNHINFKYDKDGKYGQMGKIDNLILNQAIDNFEIQSFDKSLDVKDFDLSFAKGLSFEDGCATLTKFTSHLISDGLKKINEKNNIFPNHYILCGGGRKNKFLIQSIKDDFNNKEHIFHDIDKFDFNGNFIESQAFAYIAIRSFLKLSITFPNTTRCIKSTSGGKIHRIF